MSGTIMVVDDEAPISKVVIDILTPEGFKVISASGGEEALDKLKTEKVDMMLIDFFMPGMSGRELAEKIRADPILKDMKIGFVTAASFSESGSKEFEKLNILDYIKKPFDNKDLVERVKKMLS